MSTNQPLGNTRENEKMCKTTRVDVITTSLRTLVINPLVINTNLKINVQH